MNFGPQVAPLAHTLARRAREAGVYTHPLQRPSVAFVPGLDARPWHDGGDAAVTAGARGTGYAVLRHFLRELGAPAFVAELEQELAQAQGGSMAGEAAGEGKGEGKGERAGGTLFVPIKDQKFLLESGAWEQVVLMDQMQRWTQAARRLFPRTVARVDAMLERHTVVEEAKAAAGEPGRKDGIEGVDQQDVIEHAEAIKHMPPGGIVLSRLGPQSRIKAHCAPTNARLRIGVALRTGGSGADGDEWSLRVGSSTQKWEPGTARAFDDSFENEEWNDGAGARVALLFDMWHPQLLGAARKRDRARLAKGMYHHGAEPEDADSFQNPDGALQPQPGS